MGEQKELPPESQAGGAVKGDMEGAAEVRGRGDRRIQLWIGLGGGVLLVFLIAVIALMARHPEATVVIRDIAIVFVAVETFLIGLAVIVLIVQIQMLIQVLRDEVQPLLRSVNDTAATVRGTTQFVSHSVVSPVIKLSSTLAAVSKVAVGMTRLVTRVRAAPRQAEGSINNIKQEAQDEQSGE